MNLLLLNVIILIYLLVIAYLGIKGYRETKNATDYMVGGRRIHPMVMALSYGATFISTSAIVGFGGVAGFMGMGLLWLTFLNIFVGIFIAFVFFGKRTRALGEHLDSHTFPELLGRRFDSRFIQGYTAILIFLFMPLYTAAVLIGATRFLESSLNMDYNLALLIMTVIVAAYVIGGGLKGVMYTDALQGGIMFFGMLILFFITYQKLGGITEAHKQLTELAIYVPEKLKAIGHQGWTAFPKYNSPLWWIMVTTIIMGVGIGVLAQPQLAVRFMTVKSNRELNRAVLIGGIFILAMTGVAFTVGALSNLYFFKTEGKIALAAAGGNYDKIIPLYISKAMPLWFTYIFMVTLLAAAMSTLSSQFHVMGTSLGRDFFEEALGYKGDSVLIAKLGIIIAIIFVVILGYVLPGNIIAIATAIFFGLAAAAFLPTYIAALYFRWATKAGVVSSIVGGSLISLFWLGFIHKKEALALGFAKFIFGKDFLIAKYPWMLVDPIIIALPTSFIILVVVSLLTKKYSEEHLKYCFEFGAKPKKERIQELTRTIEKEVEEIKKEFAIVEEEIKELEEEIEEENK